MIVRRFCGGGSAHPLCPTFTEILRCPHIDTEHEHEHQPPSMVWPAKLLLKECFAAGPAMWSWDAGHSAPDTPQSFFTGSEGCRETGQHPLLVFLPMAF